MPLRISFRLIFFLLDYFSSAKNPLQCSCTFLPQLGSKLCGNFILCMITVLSYKYVFSLFSYILLLIQSPNELRQSLAACASNARFF